MTQADNNSAQATKDTVCPIPQPLLLLQGIDTLQCGFFTDGIGIDWEDLAYQKELLRADGKEFGKIILGNMTFALMAYGGKPYRYMLKSRDMEVRLTERMRPNFHIKFLSEALCHKGHVTLLKLVRDWFASMGMTETRQATVTRADWAFDLALDEVDFDASNFVSRAKKDNTYRGDEKVETITFGKGNTVVRVYNKSLEIQEQSGKVWLHDLWGQTEDVWRVEVQLRRVRLKRFNIASPEDLTDHQGDAVSWAVNNHTSLRLPSDDTNKSRWPKHPLWKAVELAAAHMPQQGIVDVVSPALASDYKMAETAKSIFGMARNYAALQQIQNPDRTIPTFTEVMADITQTLTRKATSSMWDDEIKARITKMEMGL